MDDGFITKEMLDLNKEYYARRRALDNAHELRMMRVRMENDYLMANKRGFMIWCMYLISGTVIGSMIGLAILWLISIT